MNHNSQETFRSRVTVFILKLTPDTPETTLPDSGIQDGVPREHTPSLLVRMGACHIDADIYGLVTWAIHLPSLSFSFSFTRMGVIAPYSTQLRRCSFQSKTPYSTQLRRCSFQSFRSNDGCVLLLHILAATTCHTTRIIFDSSRKDQLPILYFPEPNLAKHTAHNIGSRNVRQMDGKLYSPYLNLQTRCNERLSSWADKPAPFYPFSLS